MRIINVNVYGKVYGKGSPPTKIIQHEKLFNTKIYPTKFSRFTVVSFLKQL